jgi:hypothetical protein
VPERQTSTREPWWSSRPSNDVELTIVMAAVRGDNDDFADGKPVLQIPLTTCLGVFAKSLCGDEVGARFDA